LSRHPHDPGALIEREIMLQKLKEKAAASGQPVGDSFVGAVPPFPASVQWLQEPVKSFADIGEAPLVLTFFSIEQNERIPVNEWLAAVASKYQEVGLRVVSIAKPDDDK